MVQTGPSGHVPKASPPVSDLSAAARAPSPPTLPTRINRRPLALCRTVKRSRCTSERLPRKARQPAEDEMSPSITSEAVRPFPARSTVAQRKQANEMRKTLKPLLEKRRRARINDSLSHLKSLILPLVGKDNARYSKLEKADILEMTVRFLRDLPSAPVKDSADSYRDGYKACLQRVSALLPKTSADRGACQRVSDFIQQSMSASVTPACRNCCAHSSRSLPQIQQRIQSLKSSFGSRPETQVRGGSAAAAPGGAQPGPQSVSSAMWRPW
ncbi:transcription factor HES-2-like [Betta splendens]|uniref:Transcription factor HES-2-like n=1 Tax=Betta splendens TaxID=158456 RepID=A0A6P7N2S0_BETSP|nr:transcription factor HES-2-like [Betta splendens]